MRSLAGTSDRSTLLLSSYLVNFQMEAGFSFTHCKCTNWTALGYVFVLVYNMS